MSIYTGLVHYPVYNKKRDRIVSSVTTLDIHDMARLAKTYDINKLYIITPIKEQHFLIKNIINHWTVGYGAKYNPDRREAIKLVNIVSYIEDASKDIMQITGNRPLFIATDANKWDNKFISFKDARKIIKDNYPILLLFGTAWGLHEEVLDTVDYILEPVYGRSGYRHLSVRTAAAIIIDRLLGEV